MHWPYWRDRLQLFRIGILCRFTWLTSQRSSVQQQSATNLDLIFTHSLLVAPTSSLILHLWQAHWSFFYQIILRKCCIYQMWLMSKWVICMFGQERWQLYTFLRCVGCYTICLWSLLNFEKHSAFSFFVPGAKFVELRKFLLHYGLFCTMDSSIQDRPSCRPKKQSYIRSRYC